MKRTVSARAAFCFSRSYTVVPTLTKWENTLPKSQDFFNRTVELSYLANLFGSAPRTTVVLGPADTGKTSLLVQALQDQPVMHLDMREVSTMNPEVFVSRMTEQFQSYGDYFLKLAKENIQATVEWQSIKTTLSMHRPEGLAANWSATLKTMSTNLGIARYRLLRGSDAPYPVLFIDEANRLEDLTHSPEGAAIMSDFAAWLISISKQRGQCHVVLASSDSFFNVWAKTMFGSHFTPEVIGDLPKNEALRYLEEKFKMEDSRAEELYAVYGGKIMHLKEACSLLKDKQDVRATSLYKATRANLVRACSPELFDEPKHKPYGPPLWTRKDLQTTFAEFAVSKGYLPLAELSNKLQSEQKVWSMVRYNILNYRPYAGLSCDLPATEDEEDLVTPTSACAWAAMKELHARSK